MLGEPAIGCALSPSGRHLALTLDNARAVLWELATEAVEAASPGLRRDRLRGSRAAGDLLIATGYSGITAIDVVDRRAARRVDGRRGSGVDVRGEAGRLVAIASRPARALWEPVTARVDAPVGLAGLARRRRPARHRRRRRRAGRRDRRAFDGRRRSRSGCSRDWGSGKSFLIRQVQERVRELSHASRASKRRRRTARTCATSSSTPGTSPTRTCGRAWRRTSSTSSPSPSRQPRSEAETGRGAVRAARAADRPELDARERAREAQRRHEREQPRASSRSGPVALASTSTIADETLAALKGLRTRLRLLLRFAGGRGARARRRRGGRVGVLGIDAVSRQWAGRGDRARRRRRPGSAGAKLRRALDGAGEAPRSGRSRRRREAAKRREEAERAAARSRTSRAVAGWPATPPSAAPDRRLPLAAQRGLAHPRGLQAHERDPRRPGQAEAGRSDERPPADRSHRPLHRRPRPLPAQARGRGAGGRAPDPRADAVRRRARGRPALAAAVAASCTTPSCSPSTRLDAEWESTPLNYLEKIIQIPFTLRPMGRAAVTALVARPAAGRGDGSRGGPRAPERRRGARPAPRAAGPRPPARPRPPSATTPAPRR